MEVDVKGKAEIVSIAKQREYYDKFWNSKNGLCIDEKCRADFVISNVKKIKRKVSKDLKILDLGCGRGWLTNILSEYGDVLGVDLSVKTAKKLFPNLEFEEADILRSRLFGTYDVIVSSEVIEHLIRKDQDSYVRKIYNMLNPSGYLILTTPNKQTTEKFLREMESIKLQPIENWLNKKDLEEILIDRFKINFVGSTMFYPIFFQKNVLLNTTYSLLYTRLLFYKLINRLLNKTTFGMYLTIVAQRSRTK